MESTASGPGDSIISRSWFFGDSSSILVGNRVDPSHDYLKTGSYQACLYIKTKAGCESKYCISFNIKDSVSIPTTCKAFFSFNVKDSIVNFNSEKSAGANSADTIIKRTWFYMQGNNAIQFGSNAINPTVTFPKPGTYQVYLSIATKSGCESRYSDSVVIKASTPLPVPTNCRAFFQFKQEQNQVKFNSADAMAGAGDSIINRYWIFGDGSSIQDGNRIDPPHTYTKGGSYTAILYIKTKQGCESKYAVTIQIPNPPCAVQVQFSAERAGTKKVQFNSSLSSALNDSIVSRTWRFGDNTTLTGNQVKPLKEYPIQGAYTACLKIKTANGCEAELCKPVILQDSTNSATGTQ